MTWTHERIVLIAVLTIVGVQVAAGLAMVVLIPESDKRGQFGDMFGVVNALFSGFAFAGVIYAVLLQREDLKLQREELTLTRKELQRSAEAQEKSEKALVAQAAASAQSARLSAINYLLEHYDAQLKTFHGMAYAQNDPRLARMRDLEQKRVQLIHLLDEVFETITARRA
jgi:hypothetical protein